MKPKSEAEIKQQLESCVREMNALLMELDPADRLRFVNEIFVRLMPDRKKTSSAADKLEAKHRKPLAGLTETQMQLVKRLSDATDELSDLDGDHRA